MLDAASRELAENGLEGFSIPRVAKVSGVHHTTIYRRWPTKADLVLDSLSNWTTDRLSSPPQESIEADLRLLLEKLWNEYSKPRTASAMRALFTLQSGELDEARDRYWQSRADFFAGMIERAVERGELESPIDPWRLMELTSGAMWMRVLITRRPVDRSFFERIVADALRAVR